MAGSSQKFIARNRAPRVQIEYDVELYGAEKKIQLPFVMGVLSDLSGKPADPLAPVAERKFLNGNCPGVVAAPNQSGGGSKFRERLDRPARASHRIVFEGMPHAEEKQKQCAFCPLPEGGGAGSSDQHECVDLESSVPQGMDRVPQREEAAEGIGQDIESERNSRRDRCQLLQGEADRQAGAARNREPEFAEPSFFASVSMRFGHALTQPGQDELTEAGSAAVQPTPTGS